MNWFPLQPIGLNAESKEDSILLTTGDSPLAQFVEVPDYPIGLMVQVLQSDGSGDDLWVRHRAVLGIPLDDSLVSVSHQLLVDAHNGIVRDQLVRTRDSGMYFLEETLGKAGGQEHDIALTDGPRVNGLACLIIDVVRHRPK